jgi:CHAD domain-containing protein
MSEGKWISDLTQATPVAAAARRCLKERLKVVQDYLDLALREPEKDMEHVHQLRVATRRAAAALDIFESCLSRRTYRRVQRQLRRLRRAAGAARDWDVFSLTLAAPNRRLNDAPGIDFLLGYALGQRYAAQQALEVVGGDLAAAFDNLLDKALDAIEEPPSRHAPQTLVDLARPMLASLLAELEEAGQQDLNNYEHLHQVRIVGKRLRYAMEVFVGCFPPAFRDMLYPPVEEMQEMLGRANDSQMAARRLAELRQRTRAAWPADWKRFQPALDRLLRYHQRRLPQERRRFIAWWQRWHKSEIRAMFCMLVQTPIPEA